MISSSEIIELDWKLWGDANAIAKKFHQLCGFVWLDSANPEHPDNRYHILSWSPRLVLEANDGEVKLLSDEPQLKLPDELKSQPFWAQQWLADKLNWKAASGCNLPFQGGWLGYWSYDLGRCLETMPQIACQDIALPDMQQGWYEAALIIDLQQQQVFIVGKSNSVVKMQRELERAQERALEPFTLTSGWHSNMSQSRYDQKFHQVQEYLLSGDCYQVNLAQRHCASFTGNPFQAYLALREQNSGPFSAYINTQHGAVLSVSPERFVRVERGLIQTKPIKGTRPRLADLAADQKQQLSLQRSEKDRAENLMIVDLLRNDLGRVAAPGSVQVPELFAIESFPAVHHLVSTVTATLAKEHSVYSLLASAFPGGSITGAPKLRAMEIIEELEPHRRSVYCGAIGYVSIHGQMDTNIAIRTLVCDNQQTIYCWAGGGLVADSNCASEYQETYDKLSRILPCLQEL